MRIAKSLKVIASLAALMLVSMQSYAQNSQSEASILPPRYEVELIIFRHLDQSRNTPEIPAAASMIQDSPFELQLAETGPGQDARSASDTLPEGRARATAEDDGFGSQPTRRRSRQVVSFLLLSPRPEWPDFIAFDKKSYSLNGVYNRIIRLDAYQPLVHLGWIQAAKSTAEAKPFHIESEPDAPLEVSGTITLYKERYLHLALDLSLETAPSDEISEPAAEIPPERVFGLNFSAPQDDRSVTVNETHKLQQSRRIRVSNTHYFDHPLFGVIATVSAIEETLSDSQAQRPDAG